jgi:hypothetical protein
MRIGVVGYSQQDFDKEKAIEVLRSILIQQMSIHLDVGSMLIQQISVQLDITIVSVLTNLGVPAIAYSLAKELKLKTMGIACAKAGEYECFPCDRVHIVGENWGDESETFLASIDKLIRVGGGKQSHAEVARAKELGIRVIEVDLDLPF